MPWFAAHAVMYVKFKDGNQDSYPVWENVFLIDAVDGEEAHARATARARADQGDSNGSMTWEGRAGEWVFAGLHKVLSVDHEAATLG
jgi:Domain of unknown function (DUF4288)